MKGRSRSLQVEPDTSRIRRLELQRPKRGISSVQWHDRALEKKGEGGNSGQEGPPGEVTVYPCKVRYKQNQDAQTERQAEGAVGVIDDLEPDEEDLPAQGAGEHHCQQVTYGSGPAARL